MIKLMLFVKRRADMTHDEFRDYYETTHVPLAVRELSLMRRYVRNFVTPNASVPEPEFDAIAELWFDDMAALMATSARAADKTIKSLLPADEEKFMDRASMRSFVVQECVSDVDQIRASHPEG